MTRLVGKNLRQEKPLSRVDVLRRVAELKNWRHRISLGRGMTTPGSEDCKRELSRLKLPKEMTGLRVLDVGCSDGFFSFECERRGADVLAIDDFSSLMNPGINGFEIARVLLGSRVAFRRLSVLRLDPTDIGHFDIVLFLNVLYHLRHPLLALEKVSRVLGKEGKLVVKTYFHQDIRLTFRGRGLGFDLRRQPWMRFFPADELAGDPTNWWAPNRRCLESMLTNSGLSVDRRLGIFGDRIYLDCKHTRAASGNQN